jgi:tRNA pseudouridine55 synthase
MFRKSNTQYYIELALKSQPKHVVFFHISIYHTGYMNFLLVNKPEGWTSFDAVAYIRKHADTAALRTDSKQKRVKVGHAGTLDPFATGLLIIGVGREATKQLDRCKEMPKTYRAVIMLGKTSTTQDKTGVITENTVADAQIPDKDRITEVLHSMTGMQMQTPPMFSAKKINGQRLYTLARKGIEIERKPNQIEIMNIHLLEYNWPLLTVEVECSAGTYIRTLAQDIGQKLGTGAYCQELTRTRIGPYSLSNAINLT